jgi:hypothetical protein
VKTKKNKERNDVVVLIDALLSPSVYLFCLSVDEMRQDGRDRRQQMVREFFFVANSVQLNEIN